MKKFVVIGGGTGSYTVLRGLKKHDVAITAVVSMFDSGGSTGMLRDEFGILPPGDVRRCLVALAEENGRNVLRELFSYRFDAECSLKGHSFGNLFLTALTRITGSEVEAIRQASKVLKIKGKVLPVSVDHAHLCAELEDGQIVRGETNIDVPKHDGSLRITRVFLEPEAAVYEATRRAIEQADILVIGPGDLYTSIIPNLLVKGVPEAIQKSHAKKVYVCNLMTKWGETNGFAVSDHAREILRYSGLLMLDTIICNGKQADAALLRKYAQENAYPVQPDAAAEKLAKRIIAEELVREPELIRHDSEKLAEILVGL